MSGDDFTALAQVATAAARRHRPAGLYASLTPAMLIAGPRRLRTSPYGGCSGSMLEPGVRYAVEGYHTIDGAPPPPEPARVAIGVRVKRGWFR